MHYNAGAEWKANGLFQTSQLRESGVEVLEGLEEDGRGAIDAVLTAP
jgi:hypothetical protein